MIDIVTITAVTFSGFPPGSQNDVAVTDGIRKTPMFATDARIHKALLFNIIVDDFKLSAWIISPLCWDARHCCSWNTANSCIRESACRARSSLRSETQCRRLEIVDELRSLPGAKRWHNLQNFSLPSIVGCTNGYCLSQFGSC